MTAVLLAGFLSLVLGCSAGLGVFWLQSDRRFAEGVRAGQAMTERSYGREVTDFPKAPRWNPLRQQSRWDRVNEQARRARERSRTS